MNMSTDSLTANVARLKAYKERLILFPRRSGVHKNGDSSKEEVSGINKESTDFTRVVSSLLPIIDEAKEKAIGEVKKSELPKGEEGAYRRLRIARSDARLVGVREKRAKAKAEEAQTKK